jgi:hypothetical protein
MHPLPYFLLTLLINLLLSVVWFQLMPRPYFDYRGVAWLFFCVPIILGVCLILGVLSILKGKRYHFWVDRRDQVLLIVQSLQLLTWLIPYRDSSTIPPIWIASIIYAIMVVID